MPFNWRVENGTRPAGEFKMIPSSGAILPGSKQQCLVEFISKNICRYHAALVLDIPKVQSNVLKVAVAAECVVPKLFISTDMLDFGECPLDYTCTVAIVLSNKAKLPVKFVVEEQDPNGLALAEFSASPAMGGIAAQGVFKVVSRPLVKACMICIGSEVPRHTWLIVNPMLGEL